MTLALDTTPSTGEAFSAVLCAVRAQRPAKGKPRVTDEERVAWTMLADRLHAAMLLASVRPTSPLGGVPHGARQTHSLWGDVRDAVMVRLTAEARGHARTRSPLASHTLRTRDTFAAVARGIDELFEAITEGRL